jgi:hypothetical protein
VTQFGWSVQLESNADRLRSTEYAARKPELLIEIHDYFGTALFRKYRG